MAKSVDDQAFVRAQALGFEARHGLRQAICGLGQRMEALAFACDHVNPLLEILDGQAGLRLHVQATHRRVHAVGTVGHDAQQAKPRGRGDQLARPLADVIQGRRQIEPDNLGRLAEPAQVPGQVEETAVFNFNRLVDAEGIDQRLMMDRKAGLPFGQ